MKFPSIWIVMETLLVKWVPGALPTNDTSIEFEIRPNFPEPWFKIYSTGHNKILQTSRQ